MTEPRNQRWNFRVRQHSDALVAEAATLAGVSKTAFVEESAVLRAESVIAEHQSISLSPEAFDRFVAELDQVPREVAELVDLFSRQTPIPRE